MSLFDLFDATYGGGFYEAIPDGLGGADVLNGNAVIDHINPNGLTDSSMALSIPNVEGGADIIENGAVIYHTEPNVMGGTDIYNGDMSLERTTIPNVEGGVDIYGDNMSFEGMTAPNIFGGEDYLAVMGNGDEIMSYDDPLLHSHEYRMDSFAVRN